MYQTSLGGGAIFEIMKEIQKGTHTHTHNAGEEIIIKLVLENFIQIEDEFPEWKDLLHAQHNECKQIYSKIHSGHKRLKASRKKEQSFCKILGSKMALDFSKETRMQCNKPSKFRRKIVSNLEFYTQSNYWLNVKHF